MSCPFSCDCFISLTITLFQILFFSPPWNFPSMFFYFFYVQLSVQQRWKHAPHGFPPLVFSTFVFGHTHTHTHMLRLMDQLGDRQDPFVGEIWLCRWSDVMMASWSWQRRRLQVSAAVFIFLRPWYFSTCVEKHGCQNYKDHLQFESWKRNIYGIIFLNWLGLHTNLTCTLSQNNKT